MAVTLRWRNRSQVLMSVGEYYQKSKDKSSSKFQRSPAITRAGLDLLRKWQTAMGIADWEVGCEPIAEMQVVDALKGGTPGHEFVGISIDVEKKEATIHHTRSLVEEDIIHELLHVRYPEWSEDEVNSCTDCLMSDLLSDVADTKVADTATPI